MKISLLQENLNSRLNLAQRFVSTKAQLPVLANFLLEAKEGQLFISATNLEIGISVRVPAKVEEEGSITVPARVLSELVSSLPKEKIELSTDNLILKISTPGHKTTINGMSAAEFPTFPKTAGNADLVFNSKTLNEISSQVPFASSIDEGRPALTGVLIVMDGKQLSFVATDGFRLSLKQIAGVSEGSQEEGSILIPSKVFQEAGKISSETGKEDGEVKLSLLRESNQVVFSWEDVVLSGRVIDGKFPPYEKILPKSQTTKAILDKEEFLKSIKIASIFARDSANILKLVIEEQRVKISANTPQMGENENVIEARIEGEKNEIAFNCRYLLEYLNNVAGDQVEIQLSGPLAPGTFRVVGDSSFLHVIMPVRIQG